MSCVGLAARLILAAVFAAAAAGKLADRERSAEALQAFGLPERYSAGGSVLLPLAELVLAVGLLMPSTTWWSAVAAAALLTVFVLAVSWNLQRGRAPDCHCFGQFHSSPAGPWTLTRNAALIAASAIVIAAGESARQLSPVAWVDRLSTPELVLFLLVVTLTAVVLAEAWFLLELLRQNGRILRRLEGLESPGAPPIPHRAPLRSHSGRDHPSGLLVGTTAPAFELPSASRTGVVTLSGLLERGLPVVLVFTDPHCGPCRDVLPEIAGWQREHSERLTVAVVSRGSLELNADMSRDYGVHDVLVQADREVAQAYHVHGSPSAVLVSPERQIASEIATGASAIAGLVAAAASQHGEVLELPAAATGPARPEPAAPLSIGDEVPDFEWMDLDGQPLRPDELRGKHIAVVFWNPRCGFCRRLLPKLAELEVWLADSAWRLLVISTGSDEENRAQNLRSPVVLEHDFRTGRAFGASGTPSAVVVDPSGAVASSVAVGGPALIELLTRERQTAPAIGMAGVLNGSTA